MVLIWFRAHINSFLNIIAYVYYRLSHYHETIHMYWVSDDMMPSKAICIIKYNST